MVGNVTDKIRERRRNVNVLSRAGEGQRILELETLKKGEKNCMGHLLRKKNLVGGLYMKVMVKRRRKRVWRRQQVIDSIKANKKYEASKRMIEVIKSTYQPTECP